MTIAMPSDPEARLAAALHEACYSAQTAGRGPGHGRTPTWCVAHKSRWPEGQWVCDTIAADLVLAAAVRRAPEDWHLFSVDSLAAALRRVGHTDRFTSADVMATAIIQAAKEAERE